MSNISGQFQDICEISRISGQLGALKLSAVAGHQWIWIRIISQQGL